MNIMKRIKGKSTNGRKGIVWESGRMHGCVLEFPSDFTKWEFTIGTNPREGPDILIPTDHYFYFYIKPVSAKRGCDYLVITDFDGPIKEAYSGQVFNFGFMRFRLL